MYTQIINEVLFPKFQYLTNEKTSHQIENMKQSFENHCKILGEYVLKNQEKLKILDLDFFVGFHILLYPAGFEIKATGNDGVIHIMYPGEFRKQFFLKHITNFSSVENIQKDFQKLLDDFNAIKNKTRDDIIIFYINFMSVHPFGDSNGTIAAVIADILCFEYKFKNFNLLEIRFFNKNNLFYLIKTYEEGKNTKKILALIDEFNNKN